MNINFKSADDNSSGIKTQSRISSRSLREHDAFSGLKLESRAWHLSVVDKLFAAVSTSEFARYSITANASRKKKTFSNLDKYAAYIINNTNAIVVVYKERKILSMCIYCWVLFALYMLLKENKRTFLASTAARFSSVDRVIFCLAYVQRWIQKSF